MTNTTEYDAHAANLAAQAREATDRENGKHAAAQAESAAAAHHRAAAEHAVAAANGEDETTPHEGDSDAAADATAEAWEADGEAWNAAEQAEEENGPWSREQWGDIDGANVMGDAARKAGGTAQTRADHAKAADVHRIAAEAQEHTARVLRA